MMEASESHTRTLLPTQQTYSRSAWPAGIETSLQFTLDKSSLRYRQVCVHSSTLGGVTAPKRKYICSEKRFATVFKTCHVVNGRFAIALDLIMSLATQYPIHHRSDDSRLIH